MVIWQQRARIWLTEFLLIVRLASSGTTTMVKSKLKMLLSNFAFTPGKNYNIFVISRFNFEGSIWTLMIHYDEETQDCQIRYGQDSNGNEVNIFLLVPQYVVITIGEVTNPTTPIFLNLKWHYRLWTVQQVWNSHIHKHHHQWNLLSNHFGSWQPVLETLSIFSLSKLNLPQLR